MGGRGGDYAAASAGGGSYRAFEDMPDYSINMYPGDPTEVVDWFNENSNWQDVIDGMSSGEVDTFKYWGYGGMMSSSRWKGWDNMDSYLQKDIKYMDNVLDKAYLKSGVELVRLSDAQLLFGAGKYKASLKKLESMKGQMITSKGAMSFAAAKQGLQVGDSSKNVEYKLKIPGGKKSQGAGMFIGNKKICSWGPDQREFVTNRDIAIKVGKTTPVKRGGKTIYQVELEYVGLMDHDYGKKS